LERKSLHLAPLSSGTAAAGAIAAVTTLPCKLERYICVIPAFLKIFRVIPGYFGPQSYISILAVLGFVIRTLVQ